MHADGSVNCDCLKELVNTQIDRGIDALVACGTTGEKSTLRYEEHLKVIEVTVKSAKGRVPVIAGTGSNDTVYSVELCRDAEALGADALLMVTPYYNKTSQKGLVEHYNYIVNEHPIKGGNYGPYVQTGRLDIYNIVAKYLVSIGRAYPCFCSEDDLTYMREIIKMIDTLPDTGQIQIVKSGLLNKEQEKFICEKGHKNNKDIEFCETCDVNIKGLNREEVAIIEQLREVISILENNL